MLTIGCHLSTSKGFLAMGETALSIGANTFAFFTRNPRGGKAKAIDPADAAALRELMAEHGFGPLVAHAPYTLNPCSGKPHAREFALECMADDLVRMESVPGNYYNFHPGSHVKQGAETGIELISGLLNEVLRPEQNTTARGSYSPMSPDDGMPCWKKTGRPSLPRPAARSMDGPAGSMSLLRSSGSAAICTTSSATR